MPENSPKMKLWPKTNLDFNLKNIDFSTCNFPANCLLIAASIDVQHDKKESVS